MNQNKELKNGEVMVARLVVSKESIQMQIQEETNRRTVVYASISNSEALTTYKNNIEQQN